VIDKDFVEVVNDLKFVLSKDLEEQGNLLKGIVIWFV
jgi:hypothetical protein